MGRTTIMTKVIAIAAVLAAVMSKETKPSLVLEPEREPEDEQAHTYTEYVESSPHVARGHGLHKATTGVPTSFTIELVGDDGPEKWPQNFKKFIYVWIANEDQIFIAEVVDQGGGMLTATYESSFPGDYLVYIEEVEVARHDEGRPIAGSPFSLTITGAPTLAVDELPLCGTDKSEDVEESFWRTGTWVSSRLASATHGVSRNGWVFQPRSCVYDAFSYEDLMTLASLQEETWILVLGGSVQRGLFLSLVDMALAQGQKDDISQSVLQKCWGYASVRIGSLRLTYQDVRLEFNNKVEDTVVCNNEKLASGSSAAYVDATKQFLASSVFKNGTNWPSAILAPAFLRPKSKPNLPAKVPLGALPSTWTGKLLMVDHMAGLDFHWFPANPTAATLETAGLDFHELKFPMGEDELQQMRNYQDSDPRVTFLSAYPMYQAKLFENQNTQNGVRKYGDSIHYHRVSESADSTETNNGQRMVQSTMTEMLANILISKTVGSKAQLRERLEATPDILSRSPSTVGQSFEVEHDCPRHLVPFHVKPVPELTRITVDSLPVHAQKGEVWNKMMCPAWCMAEDPVSQTPTESGPVDVRECDPDLGARL